MAKMSFDEEGLLKQPCLECEEARVDNLFGEWYCDARKCKFPDYKEPIAEITFNAYRPGQYVIDVAEDGQYHISGVGL